MAGSTSGLTPDTHVQVVNGRIKSGQGERSIAPTLTIALLAAGERSTKQPWHKAGHDDL